MQKRSTRPRQPTAPSYPVPSPETVSAMQRQLFSGRFVDNHLSALLGRASVAISEEFHEDVRQYRMPIPHWRILASLSDNVGISLSELAELTLFNQPTVTRLVQRLESKGLLRKATDAWDRRIIRVFLTKRGHEKVDQLIALAGARQEQILQGLDADALKASLQYLIAFCAAKRTLLRQERAGGAVRSTRTTVEKRRSG